MIIIGVDEADSNETIFFELSYKLKKCGFTFSTMPTFQCRHAVGEGKTILDCFAVVACSHGLTNGCGTQHLLEQRATSPTASWSHASSVRQVYRRHRE